MQITNLINNLEKVNDLELSTNIRFELHDRKCKTEYNFLSLRSALKNKKLIIKEINQSGSVPNLICKNLSEELILILGGEEIIGAKQNRIANTSLIVPPLKEISIPVSCVEQGRWAYKTSTFSKGVNAYPDLKRKLYEDVSYNRRTSGSYASNQSRIWSDIREKEQALNKFSSTGAMNQMYERSTYIDDFLEKNKDIDASGMVTYINGSIVSFEIFPNNEYFRHLFPDLVKSFYQESLLYKNKSTTYSNFFSSNSFFNYLKKIECNKRVAEGIGIGNNINFSSYNVLGDILTIDEDIIHLYSFPRK